ncbi:hypothetical protein ES707_01398 [subsurface metagenome]
MPEIKLQTNDLVSFSEAARLLKVVRMTIYNMIEREELHPFYIGQNRYLFREEVEKLANAKSKKAAEA